MGRSRKSPLLKKRREFLLLCMAFPGLLKALSIIESRFPSYRYVMEEFDIDPSYIRDPWFVEFITKNEERYRRFYENSTKRGKAYIPLFKDLLSSGGLSHLFIYLSIINILVFLGSNWNEIPMESRVFWRSPEMNFNP